MENANTRSRFVVLRHDVGARLARTRETHFDWMFEVGEVLRVWATSPVSDFVQPLEIDCESLNDHRLAYLDFEGVIDGDRGRITRLLGGSYRLIDCDENKFVAALSWDDGDDAREAMVTCYRSLPEVDLRREESCAWRLRFLPGRYETNR